MAMLSSVLLNLFLNFSAALIGGSQCFIILAHVPVRLVFFTFISVDVLGYLKLIFFSVAIFDVDHVEDLETLLRRDSRKEKRNLRNALNCNEVDVILALLHRSLWSTS